MSTLLDELEDMLSKHDWFYSYSDDFGVYRRGERSWEELSAAVRLHVRNGDGKYARSLWMHYAPGEFKDMFDRLFPDA